VSPVPAFVALIAALITSAFLLRWHGEAPALSRFAAIDGLRGFLAFFVFMHHAYCWDAFRTSGEWRMPDSRFYVHCGETSVALFFMITGFLFCQKLNAERSRELDWCRFFVARILRLVPMYWFVVVLMLVVIPFASGGVQKEPPSWIAGEIMRWLTMTIFGTPNINALDRTYLIIAGVAWSLVYEAAFYVSLPIVSMAFFSRPPNRWVAFSVFCLAIFVGFSKCNVVRDWWNNYTLLIPFVSGAITSYLVRYNAFRRFSECRTAMAIAVGSGAIAIAGFPSPYAPIPLLLLTTAFALVACGNNLCGLLTWSVARFMGEMSYSIYLLHGILLYVTFKGVIGSEAARELSTAAHWTVILFLSPILMLASYTTNRLIEKPCMRSVDDVMSLIGQLKVSSWKLGEFGAGKTRGFSVEVSDRPK